MPDHPLGPLHNHVLLDRMEKFDQMSISELYDLAIHQRQIEQTSEPGSQDRLLAVYTRAEATKAINERHKKLTGANQ